MPRHVISGLTTLIMTGLVLLVLSQSARASIDCGEQPKSTPIVDNKNVQAQLAGEASIFSKLLPHAAINGAISGWETEWHQQYGDLDQHEIRMYAMWVSCHIIASSTDMDGPQKEIQWQFVVGRFLTPSPQHDSKLWRSEELQTARTKGNNDNIRQCYPPPEGYHFDFSTAHMVVHETKGWFSDGAPDDGFNQGMATWAMGDNGQICLVLGARPTLPDAFAQTRGQVEVTVIRD